MNALRKKVMQASVTVGNLNSAGSCLCQPSAQNPQVAKCNAQPVAKNISTNLPASGKPIASQTPSEAEAIQRAQHGDEAMFEYLYRLHSPRVYAICLRMVRDVAQAEDLTQEAFLLLFRKIHTFRGESAFPTWLYRLAVNLVLMHLRKKSLPTVSIDATSDPHDETSSPGIDVGAPDLLIEGTLDRINLERCMERLPVGYRTMFVLHDVEGYEHREIAQMRGRSQGDSKSQLHKASTRLRRLLHDLQRSKSREARLAAAKTLSRSSATVPTDDSNPLGELIFV